MKRNIIEQVYSILLLFLEFVFCYLKIIMSVIVFSANVCIIIIFLSCVLELRFSKCFVSLVNLL